MRGLAARRGAQVEHALARAAGASDAADRHRRARLRHERALLQQRRAVHVEGAVEHEPLGQAGPAGLRRHRQLAPASSRGGRAQRVRAQRRLRRARCRPPSARAASRPRAPPTTARRPSAGASARSAASAGVPLGQRRHERPRPRARSRRSTALTSPAPRGASRLGQLDGLADRGVGGDAVQERELEDAEPQRGEHGGLELADRAAGQALDHVVERRARAGRRRRRAASRARGRGRRARRGPPRRAAPGPPRRPARTRGAGRRRRPRGRG